MQLNSCGGIIAKVGTEGSGGRRPGGVQSGLGGASAPTLCPDKTSIDMFFNAVTSLRISSNALDTLLGLDEGMIVGGKLHNSI